MKQYYFNPKTAGFYLYPLDQSYIDNGINEVDLKLVDESIFNHFSQVPAGKIRASDKNGMPCFIDAPEPDIPPEIIKGINEGKRDGFIYETLAVTTPLQDKIDLGIATEEEKVLLRKYQEYRIAIVSVDVTQLDPIWPVLDV